jgi:hypothetical protein
MQGTTNFGFESQFPSKGFDLDAVSANANSAKIIYEIGKAIDACPG